MIFLSKRAVGVAFCTLATVLYISRYFYTVLFYQGVTRSDGFYERWLNFLGEGPLFWATICVGVGILYLIWAEFEDIVNNLALKLSNKTKITLIKFWNDLRK